MTKLSLHPLCTLFPRMEGAEFESLRDDIRANGLREPIVTHDDMILDGGNRYRACLDAGVAPRFVKFDGQNLVSFVLSANLHRRHMTTGQQAAIVASAQDWGRAQQVGKPKSGNVTGLETVADRAAQSGASDKTQRMADKVARKSPELAKQVARGEVSLPAAHKQVSKILPRRLPPSKSEAKPEVDPLDKAREYAKKQNKRIKELQAELAERDALLEAVRTERDEARQNADELAESLQGYMTAEQGVKESAAEIAKLLATIRITEATRDQYITTNAEMIRTIKALQRKVDKLEAAK